VGKLYKIYLSIYGNITSRQEIQNGLFIKITARLLYLYQLKLTPQVPPGQEGAGGKSVVETDAANPEIPAAVINLFDSCEPQEGQLMFSFTSCDL
jgi:hypothetical protein